MSRLMLRPAPADAAVFHVTDAALTDIGLVRASNEDAVLARSKARLWAVADGMGGHEDGEWASEVIVRALAALEVTGEFGADCTGVAEAIHSANGSIHRRAEACGLRMGSTVVGLLFGNGRFAAYWAGDSRAYCLRNGRLIQLTTDHTQVQAKVARGQMTPAEARSHPMSHVLTRAVGAEADLDLSCVGEAVEPGDVFLLCSDGLHGTVPDEEIAHVLANAVPAQACEALVGLAHARGAPDNVTVVVVALS